MKDIKYKKEKMIHSIPPTYDASSKILVLGSFPSVASREQSYFYAHPQNRFWKVLAAIFEKEIPQKTEDKKSFLLQHHVAVWDVIFSCDIVGSSDSSITDVKANDLRPILDEAEIRAIFVNGRKAAQLYKKYIEPSIGIKAIDLPSTSPANAAWSLEKLTESWKILREYTE